MKNKLAKLKYMPNNFKVITEGDHVICAVSGKKILLDHFISFSSQVLGLNNQFQIKIV